MGASPNPQPTGESTPKGADKFFAGADHHMLGGRAGVDAAAGGIGVATVFGLAQKGIGPFEQSPAHLIGGFVVGAGLAEGIRAVTVDKKQYAEQRVSLLDADQQKWQRVADETK